jgi:phosphate transport system substrate-binding protein
VLKASVFGLGLLISGNASAVSIDKDVYVYVNKHPNKELAPLEKEFIKLVLSKQGQQAVIKDGYIPLPAKAVKKYLGQI